MDPETPSIERFALGRDGYGTANRHEVGEQIASLVIPGFELVLTDVFEGV